MAGKLCPNCNELTFFRAKTGKAERECSHCGLTMELPKANGKGGRGKKCSNCGRMTVHSNRCHTCGAEYKLPSNKKCAN